MRIIIRSISVLSLLALPAAVFAQAKDKAPAGLVTSGSVDFGVIASDISGDDARYNRFRDLSNGAFIDNFRTRIATNGWFMNFGADHLGRQDARYNASFVRPGQLKGYFQFDEIRELVSNSTKSLFTQVTPGVLRVDDNVQTLLQNAIGPPSTLTTVLPSTLANFNLPFELGTRRHIASGSFQYLVDKDTTVNFDVNHTNRTGAILYSGTFGFSNAVDLPQPISQHTTNASLSFERQKGDWLFRGGFLGSYFRNDDSILTWDNPYRLTDVTTLSSQGRTSVAPSNNWNDVNGSVSFKAPGHSRGMAAVSFGFLNDDGATIIPYTINTAIGVVPLERAAVGGNAHTRNATLSFVSHPTHQVSYEFRYRYYDYNNRTPVYDQLFPAGTQQRVQYDSSLQTYTTAAPFFATETDRFGGSKQTFNADMHFIAPGGHSVGVGYARNQATYDDRILSGSHEDVEHVSYDALTTRYASLHTKYEHGVRRGDVNAIILAEVAAGGEHPEIRHFDIANRDRDLFTLAASVFPINGLSFEFSAGTGRDKYPDSTTTFFGLSSADHNVYSAGMDIEPNDHLSLNAGITWDDFKSLQWSRTANPLPDPTYTDARRDWSDSAKDNTRDVYAGLSFLKLADKVDIRLVYDVNRSRGSYVYGVGPGPFETSQAATTLTAPVQLPGLKSDFKRGSFDATYALTSNLSMGFTFWYEQFAVSDLALDSKALPAFSLTTNDILMGYQYLPFTARSFFGRLVCHW